jgi:beta-galactosidase
VLDEDLRLMALAGCNAFSIASSPGRATSARRGSSTFGWLDAIMDRMAAAGHG